MRVIIYVLETPCFPFSTYAIFSLKSYDFPFGGGGGGGGGGLPTKNFSSDIRSLTLVLNPGPTEVESELLSIPNKNIAFL